MKKVMPRPGSPIVSIQKRKHPRESCLIKIDRKKPVAVAVAFPNVYRVGMANLGFQGIFSLVNERPEAYAERVFLPSPAVSAKKEMPKGGPPVTVESGRPPASFDIIAFSVSFEEDYPHVIRILHDSGIHPLRAERDGGVPLVVIGGTGMMINPAPLLRIADVIALGDGPLLVPELLKTYEEARRGGKNGILEKLSASEGFLVPERHGACMNRKAASGFGGEGVRKDGPVLVLREKATARSEPVSSVYITPGGEFGAKGLIELTRGCDHRCAFCWGGHNCGRFHAFPAQKILAYADRILDEAEGLGLVSMSAASFPDLCGLLDALRRRGLQVGLSSLRFEGMTERLAGEIVRAGQNTATLAPEAGTERMRRAIHKNISDESILEKTGLLFRAGLKNMKLYFLVGLPGERQADLDGMAVLAGKIHRLMIDEGRKKGRLGDLHISLNCFVPKPNTPFQNEPMDGIKTLRHKIAYLRQSFSSFSNLHFTAMSPFAAHIQGLFSRGNEDLTSFLLEAGRGDTTWRRAARRAGLDPENENCRRRKPQEYMPWQDLKTEFREIPG